MDMTDSRIINAPRAAVWAALNDPNMLKQCIIGCDSLDETEKDTFVAAMSVKVGPVSAKFKGKLQLEDVQAPDFYTIKFEGQGGPAGFANGSAKVELTDESTTSTRLTYTANAMIGGKLAQVGSRLVDAAARKIADDFFSKFDALVAVPVAEPTATSSEGSGDAAALVVVTKPAAAVPTWAWVVGAVVIAVVAMVFFSR
jgi:uncharacterized protein